MTEQEKYMKEAYPADLKGTRTGRSADRMRDRFDGKIIARGYNRRNTDKNTLSHAELNAIRKASKKLGDWRLEGCTMYVTLEPCQMCAGALVQSRIDEVVIGSMNPKAGCAGSVLNLLEVEGFNHKVKITRGVLEEECSTMLSDFLKSFVKRKTPENAGKTAGDRKLWTGTDKRLNTCFLPEK
ncbi:MAG: nucleoside deaminase [Coprococcus comes]